MCTIHSAQYVYCPVLPYAYAHTTVLVVAVLSSVNSITPSLHHSTTLHHSVHSTVNFPAYLQLHVSERVHWSPNSSTTALAAVVPAPLWVTLQYSAKFNTFMELPLRAYLIHTIPVSQSYWRFAYCAIYMTQLACIAVSILTV